MGKIKTDGVACLLKLDEVRALRLDATDDRLIGKLDAQPKDGILNANEISNGLRSLNSRKSVSRMYLALFDQAQPKALALLRDMDPQTKLALLTSLPPATVTVVLERLSSHEIVSLIQTGLMALPSTSKIMAPLIEFAYHRHAKQVQALFRDAVMETQVRLLLLSTESVQRNLLTSLVYKRGEEGVRDLSYIIRHIAKVDANGVFGALILRQVDPKTARSAIDYSNSFNEPLAFKKYLKSVSAYSPNKMPLMQQVEYFPTREQAEARARENGWNVAAKPSAKYGLQLAFVESYKLKGFLIVPDSKDRVCIVESTSVHKDTPKEKERRQRILEKAFPPGFKYK